MKVFAVRLKPDEDLRQSLKAFAIAQNLQAGFILSGIGSLSQAKIRFANQPESTLLPGKFEILSLNGTVSIHGIHLHAAIADAKGTVIGGHVDNGCVIYTTAEIVIGESETFTFLRTPDPQTGFLELEIRERPSQDD